MRIRKIALLLGVTAVALCGCSNKSGGSVNTETPATQEELPPIEINTERATEMLGDTETAAESESSYEEITSDEEVKMFDSVAMVGDAAYELYTYKADAAEDYAKAVNELADKYAGKVNVYDIVIPLGSGIVFPDNLKDQIKNSDQKKAMDDIHGMMNDNVKTVDIYDSLMSHRTEYIYFRTDHHWTPLGAYYAYQKFCEVKGIEPEALDSYEIKEFDGFLGSFYKDTDNSEVLKNNKDTITAYMPHSKDTIMHVTADDGTEYDWNVIYDVSGYAPGLKYSAFVAGDNPYSVIENKDLTDGSSCIVLKESFGNAFTPFLVDHYQTIYLVDYRYFTGKLSKLIEETGATDVIMLNNLSMIRNKYLVGQLKGVMQ